MAQINIEQSACRGCELCVDECPTKVFEYDAANAVPVVARKDDCVECLSCFYICPSTAIGLEGIEISKELHRDLSIRDKMKRFLLEQDPYAGQELAVKEYEQALKDMFVRLQAMSDVYHHIAGKSLPALGTSAGQEMARHFPLVRPVGSIDDALGVLKEELSPAWVIDYEVSGSELRVRIGDCFIRESCQFLGRPLGENLCVLFGGYMIGNLYARLSRRFKILNVVPGDTCSYEIKVFN